MKLTPVLTATCAAAALLLTSCDNDAAKSGDAAKSSDAAKSGDAAKPAPPEAPAVSEKDAIASFKTAAEEINKLVAEGKAAGDPVAGMPKMQAAIEKMKAIKTEGLPADLKDAFVAARTGMEGMLDVFKDMPKDPAELPAFFAKLGSDPKIVELQKTGQAATEKFKEIATKYGITIAD